MQLYRAALNASKSSSSKFSPFYLVFHRDPILPIDTIMAPRDRYYGDDYLPTALEVMHRSYYLVRKRLQRQTQKSIEYFSQRNKIQEAKFEVGDPVFLKNHQRTSKLDPLWLPFYRVLSQNAKYSYSIQHQTTGKVRRAHASHLRLANDNEQWGQFNHDDNRRQGHFTIRYAKYQVCGHSPAGWQVASWEPKLPS